MPGEPLTCPLCDWTWRHEMETWHVPKQRFLQGDISCDSHEFLLADHLMNTHMQYTDDVSRRELRCFCGRVVGDYITIVMAHMRHYGGVAEHYRAWQLGID